MIATEPVGVVPDPSLDRAPQVRGRRGAPAHARTHSPTNTRTRIGVTPARLRLIAIGLAVLALAVGLVTALAANNRDTATSAALQTSEPLVVEAQAIDTYLSDADTTAAGSFLQGQLQPASLRTRYMNDVAHASANLALAAQAAGSDPAVASAIRSVAVNLPTYTGLVQTATFNERQSYYPLATAYIGEANNLMRLEILPAAAKLYTVENQQLTSDQDNAVSSPLLWTAVFFIVALLVLLIVAQVWMSGHFRRTFNLFLAVSTAIVFVLALWFTVAVITQNSSVDTATANGSGPVVLFTQARIGALQMMADDELTLLTRNSIPTYQQDYDTDREAIRKPHDIGQQGCRFGGRWADQAGGHLACGVYRSPPADQTVRRGKRREPTGQSGCPGLGERPGPAADGLVEPRQQPRRCDHAFPAGVHSIDEQRLQRHCGTHLGQCRPFRRGRSVHPLGLPPPDR